MPDVSRPGAVRLRAYADDDAAATRAVFERAVHNTAATRYDAQQLDAWAPPLHTAPERAEWGRSRAAAATIVAVADGSVIGFADRVGEELLDMLYVDPAAGRRGVGSALIAAIVRCAHADGAPALVTDASLIARPLFARHGFRAIRTQRPVVRGVAMTNVRMRLSLGTAAGRVPDAEARA